MERYTDTEWFFVEKNGITRALTRNDFNLSRSSIARLAENDLLDGIAWKELQDSRAWYVIAEINLPLTYDPLDIVENTSVIIPSVDQVV